MTDKKQPHEMSPEELTVHVSKINHIAMNLGTWMNGQDLSIGEIFEVLACLQANYAFMLYEQGTHEDVKQIHEHFMQIFTTNYQKMVNGECVRMTMPAPGKPS